MNQPPLNPDALEASAKAMYNEEPWQKSTYSVESYSWGELQEGDRQAFREEAKTVVTAYLAVALPEVTSVKELKALPIGSVILDGGGDAGIIEPGAILFAETNPLSPEYVAKHYLPARVLYRPEVNDA